MQITGVIMGDETFVEINMHPQQNTMDNMFYKVTSSGIIFSVKFSGFVAIGLAYSPSQYCRYWVIIEDAKHISHIKECNFHPISLQMKKTPGILSANELRKFWIRWDMEFVRFGRAEDTSTPILEHESVIKVTENIRYCTFTSGPRDSNSSSSMQLLFKSPPVKAPIQLRPLKTTKPEWVYVEKKHSENKLLNTKLTVPKDALIGGYEDEPLYIMRARHETSLTPGKLVASQGLGYLAWEGAIHEKKEFEVLCGMNCVWEWSGSAGPRNYSSEHTYTVPEGAIQAGFTEDTHEPLYIGRANHNGHLIPGKICPSHKVCYIPFEGKEIAKTHFQILLSTNQKMTDSGGLFVGTFNDQIREDEIRTTRRQDIIDSLRLRISRYRQGLQMRP